MVKALILYTNGKYKEVELKDIDSEDGLDDYQKYVEGSIQSLPITRDYINPLNITTKKQRLSCYVNEEGMLKDLPSNQWAGFLGILGVRLNFGGIIYGNVIVLSNNDKNIDPYIVNLAKQFKECEDEDDFYVSLQKINTKKSQSNKKSDSEKEEIIKSIKSSKNKKPDPTLKESDDIINSTLNNDDKKRKRKNSKGKDDMIKKTKNIM
jgi:hypothetical protein